MKTGSPSTLATKTAAVMADIRNVVSGKGRPAPTPRPKGGRENWKAASELLPGDDPLALGFPGVLGDQGSMEVLPADPGPGPAPADDSPKAGMPLAWVAGFAALALVAYLVLAGRRGALLLVLALVPLLMGCGGADRFRIVEGPAHATVAPTAFTPGIEIAVEQGGRAYFGPTLPGGAVVVPPVPPVPGAPVETPQPAAPPAPEGNP